MATERFSGPCPSCGRTAKIRYAVTRDRDGNKAHRALSMHHQTWRDHLACPATEATREAQVNAALAQLPQAIRERDSRRVRHDAPVRYVKPLKSHATMWAGLAPGMGDAAQNRPVAARAMDRVRARGDGPSTPAEAPAGRQRLPKATRRPGPERESLRMGKGMRFPKSEPRLRCDDKPFHPFASVKRGKTVGTIGFVQGENGCLRVAVLKGVFVPEVHHEAE